MKIETRNQLLGVIIGTAIALGINLLPGLSSQVKLWAVFGVVLILAIFKFPILERLSTTHKKDDIPKSGSSGPDRK